MLGYFSLFLPLPAPSSPASRTPPAPFSPGLPSPAPPPPPPHRRIWVVSALYHGEKYACPSNGRVNRM